MRGVLVQRGAADGSRLDLEDFVFLPSFALLGFCGAFALPDSFEELSEVAWDAWGCCRERAWSRYEVSRLRTGGSGIVVGEVGGDGCVCVRVRRAVQVGGLGGEAVAGVFAHCLCSSRCASCLRANSPAKTAGRPKRAIDAESNFILLSWSRRSFFVSCYFRY